MQGRPRKSSIRRLTTYGHSRAIRLPDFDYVGDVNIHLTICAHHGSPFADQAVSRMACRSVEKTCRLRDYDLFGYCLMPNHLHVLLSPSRSTKPSDAWLRDFKSYTTNQFMKLGQTAPLWQRSAHDHVCRVEETAEAVIAYIIENPVRAGLVERWQAWPWTKVFIAL